MTKIARLGQLIFGIAIAALGIEHLLCAQMAVQPFPAQFHAIVIPVIPWIPAHPWLAYLTGAVLILSGLGIVTKVRAGAAAILVCGIFLGADAVLHIPHLIAVPGNWGLRGEVCEMLAFAAAAFVLAGSINVGRVLFGISAMVFGVDHFLALNLIASLIPAWMPGHTFLACLTGAGMVAAGISLVTKWMAGWGAFGLGAIFLLIFVTLHVARVIAAPKSPDEWSSALIALGMCGASWICATAIFGERKPAGA